MRSVMISLIGEQPIPNLLPIRYLKPAEVVLAYTERTERVYHRLKRQLEPEIKVHPLEKVPPYDINAFQEYLQKFIHQQGWLNSQIIFNLTGGTKSMGFSAYELARSLSCQFLYFQSEGAQSKLFRHQFENGKAFLKGAEIISSVLNINDYILAFVDEYKEEGFSRKEGGKFEEYVYNLLNPSLDECLAGVKLYEKVDIDLVCRLANQVAIIEVKSGKEAGKLKGIRQLNTAGSRECLGIYTKKVLIIDRIWDKEHFYEKELAKAYNVHLIELPGYSENGVVSKEDQQKAIQQIHRILGKNRI